MVEVLARVATCPHHRVCVPSDAATFEAKRTRIAWVVSEGEAHQRRTGSTEVVELQPIRVIPVLVIYRILICALGFINHDGWKWVQ